MMDPERKIEIMGIVNLTDDSYYAPSRCLEGADTSVSRAMERIRQLLDEGADIIDLGACSSRPGAVQLGSEVEWKRLEPLLSVLFEEYPDIRLSIDTYHSSVVSRAYALMSSAVGEAKAAGQLIVNDISAGEDDPGMLSLVGSLGLTYIAMHKRGRPEVMQDLCDYDDVSRQVKDYFSAFALRASRAGIRDWIIDPGFGFAKTVEQNYHLLRELDRLSENGEGRRRILVGLSRKSMIYKMLNITPEEALPATQVLHLKALQKGADILRVHDVAEAVRTVALYRVLR